MIGGEKYEMRYIWKKWNRQSCCERVLRFVLTEPLSEVGSRLASIREEEMLGMKDGESLMYYNLGTTENDGHINDRRTMASERKLIFWHAMRGNCYRVNMELLSRRLKPI